MEGMKCCPIENTLKYIGKKWSINLIRDLFLGKKKFKDFLISNPDLSTKVLSERLKELETNKVINKKVVSTSPVTIEYSLTNKGKALKKILYELAVYSIQSHPEDVFEKKYSQEEANKFAKKMFS